MAKNLGCTVPLVRWNRLTSRSVSIAHDLIEGNNQVRHDLKHIHKLKTGIIKCVTDDSKKQLTSILFPLRNGSLKIAWGLFHSAIK